MRRVVVCGGAGFLGSHIVERFVRRGDRVTVIDGLVPGTGGARRHLAAVAGDIDFHHAVVGSWDGLSPVLADADVVVDAMAWTSHVAALGDPLRDLQLNLASHLHLLEALRGAPRAAVIYLGSRSQFGRVSGRLTAETAMDPIDVQGIHKAAADHHFRLRARLHGLRVVSVRLPNCYGERQPVAGDDIGLVGGFVRAALAGETIEVYGERRRRGLLYALDAAAMVERLADAPAADGFAAVNAGGSPVAILDLAQQVVAAAGRGTVVTAPLPAHVRAIDAGDPEVDEAALRAAIGEPPCTPLPAALEATVRYFKETAANDLAL